MAGSMIHCMGSKVPIAMSGFTSDSQTRKKECFRLSSTQRLLSNTARVSCKLISVAIELIVVTGTTTTWFGRNQSIFILVCTAAGKRLFFSSFRLLFCTSRTTIVSFKGLEYNCVSTIGDLEIGTCRLTTVLTGRGRSWDTFRVRVRKSRSEADKSGRLR